jgi:hypothetical protein
LKQAVLGLYEDSKGNLWAGAYDGFWRWKPGPPQYYPLPVENYAVLAFAESEDGTLLIGGRNGIWQLLQGKIMAYRLPGDTLEFQTRSLLRDRDGALWIGTLNGLVHVHGEKKDVFAQADGLSGDPGGNRPFQDREGQHLGADERWVWTAFGNSPYRQSHGSKDFHSTLFSLWWQDEMAGVWLSTFDGLNRWYDGQLTIIASEGARRLNPSTQLPGSTRSRSTTDWATTISTRCTRTIMADSG